MIRNLSVCIAIAVGVAFCGFAFAAQLNFSISFDRSDLSFSKRGAYDLVEMEGCDLLAEPGHPLLPQKLLSVAIPAGSRVKSLRVTSVDGEEIEGEYFIFPGQPDVPISVSERPQWVEPDEKIYRSRNLFPEAVMERRGQGSFSGHWIADFVVHPVRYRPEEGKLLLHTRIVFEVELEHTGLSLPVKVRSKVSERLVSDAAKSVVINPEAVRDRVAQGSHSLDILEVEYLIITNTSHADRFQQVADWKTKKGVPAKVVTTDWIYANYSGTDNAEKVRNCIIDHYANKGLIWVLLGGDVNVVPYRGCYGKVGGYTDNNMPCDLYFSDLDGDFNFDGDGIYGELSDSVDLYPDVFVGRAPISTAAECSLVVRKILVYENALNGTPIPSDYQLKMLYLAEWLDGSTDAGLGKNIIDNAYVPPRYDPISKLYESSGNLNRQAAVDSMNTGYAIVNHSGHSNSGVMSVGPNSLRKQDMYGLTNDTRFSVLYSIGCIAAAFENNDCIAEKFVLAPGGGGFFVGNSRYGWYSPGNPGGGPSERYDQTFFSCLYDGANAKLGMAEGVSKTYYISWSRNNNAYRWVQFCLNLLGEPEGFVWTDTPRDLSPIYASIIGDKATQFDVTVNSEDQPVESALVCVMKDDEVYLRDVTDGNGKVTFVLPPITVGTMYVTITAHNYLPHEGETEIFPTPNVPVLLSPPDGQISGNTMPTMFWSPTIDPGGSYTLEYSKSEDFSAEVVTISGLEDRTYSVPDTAPLSDSIYFWHVQAFSSHGVPSGYQGVARRFTVDTHPPEFSNTTQWPDTAFQGPYYVETTITDLSGLVGAYLAHRTDADTVWRFKEMKVLNPQGGYYENIPAQPYGVTVGYYVYAADNSDPVNTGSDPPTAPEGVYSFEVVEPVAPDIPVLLSPPDGQISGNTKPTMVWSSTAGSGGDYTLEYSKSEDFSTDVVTISGLEDTTYGIPDTASLSDSIYFWHVQAISSHELPSGYQDVARRFTVDTHPPEFSNTTQWPDTAFQGPYYVETTISDLSGLIGAYRAYRTNLDTVWRFKEMKVLNPEGGYYEYIPAQPWGATVEYYIRAADNSDPINTGFDPLAAPDSVYSFLVLDPVGVELTRPLAAPSVFFLQASPNPARFNVELHYGLPRESDLRMEIYDSAGRLVRTLASGMFKAGSYRIRWDGRSDEGETMPSGLYYARLSAASKRIVSKVVLVR